MRPWEILFRDGTRTWERGRDVLDAISQACRATEQQVWEISNVYEREDDE